MLLAVHDDALIEYLASAWDDWKIAGLPDDPGQDRVVPYVFAHRGLSDAPAVPTAPAARAGYFAYLAQFMREQSRTVVTR